MKKLSFRIVSLVLVLSLFLTSLTSLSAYAKNEKPYYENDINQVVSILSDFGIFKGSDKGYELDRVPTKTEAAVMLVRLLGAEADAISNKYSASHNIAYKFEDVPQWAMGYVNYLYKNNITKGNSENSFGASEPIDAKSYLTFMLRTLGYSDDGGRDFTWQTAIDDAYKLGVFLSKEECERLKSGEFKRAELALISYQILGSKIKGSSDTLALQLYEKGAIDEELAIKHGFVKKQPITAFQTSNYQNETARLNIQGNILYADMYDIKNDITAVLLRIVNVDDGASRSGIINAITNSSCSRDISSLPKEKSYFVDTYIKRDNDSTWKSYIYGCVQMAFIDGQWQFKEPIAYKTTKKAYYNLGVPTKSDTSESGFIDSNSPEIVETANMITQGISGDYEKALAIHDWVASNIAYNYDYYLYRKGPITYSASGVLNSRTSVCEGYANLTAALLRACGIPCRQLACLVGYEDSNPESRGLNHAINAAYVDGRWIFLDTTWDSRNEFRDGKFIMNPEIKHRYFDPTLLAFSFDHKVF